MVARAERKGGMGMTADAYGVSFWGDEMFWNKDHN